MDIFLRSKIDEYTKYLGNNLPYVNPDGTILEVINLDYQKLADEYIIYSEMNNNNESLDKNPNFSQGISLNTINPNAKSEQNMAKIHAKSYLHDADLKEFLMKFANNHVFVGTLAIVNQRITNETCLRISNILMNNHPNITSLILSNNEGLSADGGIALGEALKINTTVIHLDLRGTNLEADGTNRIIEALRYNSTLRELQLGAISSSNLEYLSKFLEENSYLNWIAFEEPSNHVWNANAKTIFLKTLRGKDNARILSVNIKTENLIKHELFLGEIAKICEFNRKSYFEELEIKINQNQCINDAYYSTEADILKSEIFSIKSYLTNIFGTILEEGLYSLDKERVDMIRDAELAKIEGKTIAKQNENLLQADGSIYELAKFLLKKVNNTTNSSNN